MKFFFYFGPTYLTKLFQVHQICNAERKTIHLLGLLHGLCMCSPIKQELSRYAVHFLSLSSILIFDLVYFDIGTLLTIIQG